MADTERRQTYRAAEMAKRKSLFFAIAARVFNRHSQRLEQQIDIFANERDEALEQSTIDPLTGIGNRRFFDTELTRTVAHATRRHEALSILFIDFDNFKDINDVLEHSGGDEALRIAAEFFTNLSRGEEIVCRFGGDEFAIILPSTGASGAKKKAERISKESQSLHIHNMPIRFSIGIGSYMDWMTKEDLLRQADTNTYHVKKQGKNGYAEASGKVHLMKR